MLKVKSYDDYSKLISEKSSSKAIKELIPGQAMKLAELVSRFERGQRLNIHENFKAMSNFTEGRIEEESFDDAPPDDVHDVVDVQRYHEELKQRKSAFEERKKKRQESTEPQQPPKEGPQGEEDSH